MRVAVLLAALLVLAACGGEDGMGEPEAPAAAAGIAGRTLDGRELSLTAFRGKRVLVNVWSSW